MGGGTQGAVPEAGGQPGPGGPTGQRRAGRMLGGGFGSDRRGRGSPAPAMPHGWQLEGLWQSRGAHPFVHRKMMGNLLNADAQAPVERRAVGWGAALGHAFQPAAPVILMQ